MTPDLTHLLEQVAAPVAERDFVDTAWEKARLRRRRNHVAMLGAAAAASVVAAAVMVMPLGDGPGSGLPASPASNRPSATGWQATPFDVMGVRAVLGPTPDQVGQLSDMDETTRARIPLPSALTVPAVPPSGAGQPDTAAQPADAQPVRAVLLRYTGPGVVRPVLYRPNSTLSLVEMDAMELTLLTDNEGNASEPLGNRAINEDRRRIVFPQPGKVLLLDAQAGDFRSFPVADDHLEDAGWAADGATIIARSETGAWRIDSTTGEVERLADVAYPGFSQVIADETGVRLLRFASTGTKGATSDSPPIFSDTWGPTVTSPAEWVAAGGFLTDPAQAMGAYQGVFAIEGERMANPRILLAPAGNDDRGLGKGCCAALGWVSFDRLLVHWGSDIVLWNVVSGEIARVSKAPVPVYGSDDRPTVGSVGSSFAIAP